MTKKFERAYLKLTAAAGALLLALSAAFSGAYLKASAEGENTPGAIETDGDGIADLGAGGAFIEIKGNDGQTLEGKRFEVYELLFAHSSVDGESTNYEINPEYEDELKSVVAQRLDDGNGGDGAPGEVTDYMVIDYIRSIGGQAVLYMEFVEALRDRIRGAGVPVIATHVRGDNSIMLRGLGNGYYLIDEVTDVAGEECCAASLCMADTANPDAQINIKSDYPSNVVKKIQEDDLQFADITDPEGWNDIGDFEIGQKVPYRFESPIPDMEGYSKYYYCWHDKMDDALTLDPGSVGIEIAYGDDHRPLAPEDFEVRSNPNGEDTFTVAIDDLIPLAGGYPAYSTLVLTFTATLNDIAADDEGRPGFENDVRLEFSNDPEDEDSTGLTPLDTAVCFTYKLEILKENDMKTPLAGAKFRLYSGVQGGGVQGVEEGLEEVYVKEKSEGSGDYIVINRDSLEEIDYTEGNRPEDAVETMESGEDGKIVIHGLDRGTYYIEEAAAPPGYRTLEKPIKLTVEPEYSASRDDYVKGDGAGGSILKDLRAHAFITPFYDMNFEEQSEELETDVVEGEIRLTIQNRIMGRLPVTGTYGLIILFASGIVIMSASLLASGRRTRGRRGMRRGMR